MAKNTVPQPLERAERLAKLKRDMSELRARMTRIDHETHRARQDIDDLERQALELATEVQP